MSEKKSTGYSEGWEEKKLMNDKILTLRVSLLIDSQQMQVSMPYPTDLQLQQIIFLFNRNIVTTTARGGQHFFHCIPFCCLNS